MRVGYVVENVGFASRAGGPVTPPELGEVLGKRKDTMVRIMEVIKAVTSVPSSMPVVNEFNHECCNIPSRGI